MKRLLFLAVALLLPLMAHAQTNRWNPTAFADSLKAAAGNGGHGIAVDPDGKIWFQPFSGTVSFTFPDTVLIFAGNTGTPSKSKTRNMNAIYVFNADGTQAAFSPITFLRNGQGAVTDTLGLYYMRMQSGRMMYDTRTGRGLRASPKDGNIYVSQGGSLFRIDYRTGTLLNKVRDVYGRDPSSGFDIALTASGVDGEGNVYTATVVRSETRPIRQYAADLSAVLDANVVAAPAGFSRAFEVSRNALRLYWAGYTTHAIHMYKRDSEFNPFVQVPDTVLKGFDSESVTIHPVTGALWASAGSANDLPNRYATFRAPYTYQTQTWYSFDQTQLSAANPNPMPLDSIKWQNGGAGRPRGLGFNVAGTIAYATQFNQAAPVVQKWVFGPGSAAEPTEVPVALGSVRAFPNPSTGQVRIAFDVTAAGPVTLKVYDTLGREVAVLVDEMLAPRTYEASLDGGSLTSGTYVYRLVTAGGQRSGVLSIVR